MLEDAIFNESIPSSSFLVPHQTVSQIKPCASHMTDISHFEVVKDITLMQQLLEPAEVELSSKTEDEMVLPIYFFIC